MDELDTTVLGLEGAAFQSRLPFTELSPLEKEIFPEVVSADNDTLKTYLLIRNRTLQLWLENPKSELIYEQVIQSSASKDFVSSKYNTLCLKIHRFLSRHGYINFGIFNRIHPIRKVKNCKVVVIGAGMAGLAAARQLASFGIEVVVLEARDRVGGRVATFRKGKYTADLGAMVVTGLGGNPITVISQQIGMEMHKIKQDCPLYETGGKRVSKEKDVLVEQEFNKLLEATSQLSREIGDYEKWKSISLGNAFELVIQVQEKRIKEELISHWTKISDAQSALKRVLTRMVELEQTALRLDSEVKQLTAASLDSSGEAEKENGKMVLERKMEEWRAACDEYDGLAEKRATHEADVSELERTQPSDVYLSSSDRQLLDWHLANLEFANASPLDKLSLHHWNQDDAYEFSGSHLAVKNGYAVLPVAYADSLDVRLNTVVKRVAYRDDGCTVATQSTLVNTGEQEMECDAVLCTLPLGVLRPPNPELDHGPNVIFEPSLPDWKTQAIARLGFGNLNKVVMCFERAFWDTSAHLFGHVGATTSSRGELFLFWGIYRAPLLIALVAGQAANVLEHIGDGVVISRTVAVLRAIFGAENVPEPISYTVTRWGSDPWCRGSYSYVATGSSGHDYDVMASPVDAQGSAYEDVTANGKARLFFAGEHTMRNYPATVHGAFLSGVREAARIADIFLGPLLAAVDPSPPDDDVL